MIINLVAEGNTEEAVTSRLLPYCGHELGIVYGMRGCNYVRQKAAVFHHLATDHSGILVMTDFRDASADCVPTALQEYLLNKLPNPPRTYVFCFAVNEIESWLLADRKGIAHFLRISEAKIPLQPDNEDFPKKTLVSLARSSRIKAIREGIAPPPGHRSSVGPEYQSLLREYIVNYWDPEAAMSRSKSLERCISRLRSLNSL